MSFGPRIPIAPFEPRLSAMRPEPDSPGAVTTCVAKCKTAGDVARAASTLERLAEAPISSCDASDPHALEHISTSDAVFGSLGSVVLELGTVEWSFPPR